MSIHELDLYRKDVMVRGKPPVRLSVIDAGRDSADAPALIFVHGFGGYALQWAHQMLPFLETHRVVALDLRGHGLSDRPRSDYSLETLVNDLERVVESLELPPSFVLIGHSFGGAISATYAVAFPERVEKLVLIGTAVDFFAVHPGARVALHLPSRLLQPMTSLFPKRLAAPARVLRAMYHDALRRWDGNDVLSRVSQPTLVVMGERDVVFDRKAYDAVPDCIADCQVVKVSVSAHLVHLERSEAVNRALRRFLKRAPSAQAVSQARAGAAPWTHHYELGVPAVLRYPRLPVHRLLDAAAQRFPDRRAVVFEKHALGYSRLRRATDRVANALIALGVLPGDRVAVLLENSPALVTSHFAANKAGAAVVSLNPALPGAELSRQIESVGASVLITDPLLLDGLSWSSTPDCLREVVLAETGASGVPLAVVGRSSGRWRRRAAPLPAGSRARVHPMRSMLEKAWQSPPNVPVAPEDVAKIEYSSGTTGEPKAIPLSHENLVANVIQIRGWLQDLQDGREVILCAVDLSHSYGGTVCMNLGISVAATLVLLAKPGVPELLRAISRHRPTIFPGTPDLYLAINDHPRVRRYDLKSIRACVSGGAPLPREVQEVFERLTRGRLVEGYGLTEAGPVTHVNPLHGFRKPGSIGLPLPGTDARIVDPATRRPLWSGERGELEVRGPQVMKGYRNASAEGRLRDGWLATGDVAWMDEDGFFFIAGRLGEALHLGGHPVYPRDIEEILLEHPDVREASVTQDETGLTAHVVLREAAGIGSSELTRFCRERLHDSAVPRRFHFTASLPKARLGKVLRRKLGSGTAS